MPQGNGSVCPVKKSLGNLLKWILLASLSNNAFGREVQSGHASPPLFSPPLFHFLQSGGQLVTNSNTWFILSSSIKSLDLETFLKDSRIKGYLNDHYLIPQVHADDGKKARKGLNHFVVQLLSNKTESVKMYIGYKSWAKYETDQSGRSLDKHLPKLILQTITTFCSTSGPTESSTDGTKPEILWKLKYTRNNSNVSRTNQNSPRVNVLHSRSIPPHKYSWPLAHQPL